MRQIATTLSLLGIFTLSTAIAQAEHTVQLAWTASTDASTSPSLTYNIYRSTACSGSFEVLSSLPVAAAAYLDLAVYPGIYCYRVIAVLNDAESMPSAQAAVVVPSLEGTSQVNGKQSQCARRGSMFTWVRCVASLSRVQ